MIKFRYVLFYSERKKQYRLAKVKADNFNPKNPDVLWIFNQNKLNLAKRVLKNMNLAITTSDFPNMQIAS